MGDHLEPVSLQVLVTEVLGSMPMLDLVSSHSTEPLPTTVSIGTRNPPHSTDHGYQHLFSQGGWDLAWEPILDPLGLGLVLELGMGISDFLGALDLVETITNMEASLTTSNIIIPHTGVLFLIQTNIKD